MNFKKITSHVFKFLGMKGKENEHLELTKEQKEKLDSTYRKGFAEKFEIRHNELIGAEKENADALKAIDDFMEKEGINVDNDNVDTSSNSLSTKVTAITKNLEAERKRSADAEAKLAVVKDEPEPDKPLKIEGKLKTTLKHSKTHLFSSTNSWDAFENRSWNKAAAGNFNVSATDWNTANIEQLNKDIQDYFRKDPKTIVSTFMDGLELPSHWGLISGVSDEYIFTTISTGEVTQGLKVKWLPKNNAKFDAQKGKVRDIQIDLEFKGDELKKLEKSYLNNFFNEGSNPYKDSFIIYVVKELMKQARKEDKIVIGKGVYFPNTDAVKAGSFLNNFSGVIKLALEQRGKTYKPFNLGEPTEENIYDYVKKFVKNLPHEIRILPDLYFYLSPSWLDAYREARRRVKGRDQDFTDTTITVDGFSNIKLFPYDQLEGYNFMFLTTEDNIKILTDKPGEDSVLKFERSKRDTFAHGDYKLASFIGMFGKKLIGKEVGYDNQLFFSNDVEALNDVYVPVESDNPTPSLKYHNSIIMGSNNTRVIPLTDLLDAEPGTKVYLLGNDDTNFYTIKNGGKFSLIDGDVSLKK
jgi:hypothetical protein